MRTGRRFSGSRVPWSSIREGLRGYMGQSALSTANLLILAASGLVFWVVAAARFDVVVFGLASAAVAGITMLVSLGRLGMDFVALRMLPSLSPTDAAGAIAKMSLFAVFGTLVASVVAIAGDSVPLWPGTSGIVLLVVASVSLMATRMFDPFATALERADLAVLKSVATSILRILFVGLVPVEFSWAGILAAFTLAGVPPVLIGSFWLGRVMPLKSTESMAASKPTLGGMVREAGANYAFQILTTANGAIATLLVLHWNGPIETAMFHVLWTVGVVATFGAQALAMTMTVRLAKYGEASHLPMRAPLVLSGAVAIAVIFVAQVGGPILPGAFSSLSGYAILPFSLTSIPYAYYARSTAVLRATKHLLGLVLASLSVLVPFLGLTAVLRAPAGAIGWTWLASVTLGAGCAHMLSMAKRPGPRMAVAVGD